MLSWIEDVTRFIFLEDAPEKADILFIPGNGHAAPSELAARLFREGFAPYVIPSGRYAIGLPAFAGQVSGVRRYEGPFETEWAFMRHILMENGVPDSAILREDEATYTYQNAIHSRKRTDELGLRIRSAIICCMPVHARRAKMYYETLFPEARLTVCPAPGASVTKDNWMHSETGVDTVLGELERCGSQFHAILRDVMRLT
ncbi:MAG: YdcF family protein [Clostridia bacterium]|nr:YdcF family protein [Clostridia bacterium]